ncbi:MAG TPA: hypothetical protein VH062_17995 [Polyangiaceae bacterium]|jgi:hypothetical protein|nr:hypothetical protein [Polyangiaceae bacterium]
MLKTLSIVAGACGALALSCASNQGEPQVAAESGCRALGETSQAVATTLGPQSVYAAKRVDTTRPDTVTGVEPGTRLYVRAAPGVSQEYLERVLSCHAAYGNQVGANDPFRPQSGRVTGVEVSSAGAGYEVRIVGQNSDTNDEIWHRAHDLAYSTVQTEQLASTSTTTHAQ